MKNTIHATALVGGVAIIMAASWGWGKFAVSMAGDTYWAFVIGLAPVFLIPIIAGIVADWHERKPRP